MIGAGVGFFGKLPSHGDFIERRVNGSFRDIWDQWLQRCIAQSQRTLGDRWLDFYLTSPMWRFFLSDGVAGAASFAGVLLPSVDRVGRYFPLTVVVELSTELSPLSFASASAQWFEEVEQLCSDALRSQSFELAAFDASLSESAAALVDANLCSAHAGFRADASQWRWAIKSSNDLEGPIGFALMTTAQSALRPLTMWWTDGSEHVQPSALLTRGLPRPESFAALLAGTWNDGQWQGDLFTSTAPESLAVEPSFETHSAGATDAGVVRESNQDNFVLCDVNRLWVVADGMGGHKDGDVASQMVVDALNSLESTASLNALLESISVALERVNADLRRSALSVGSDEPTGSTVVTLGIRGSQFLVCWAGDSRVYLYRNHTLVQITRDHVAAPPAPEESSLVSLVNASGEITRAVGGVDLLELEHVVDSLIATDRFLLCSDGLYGALPESTIMACLQRPTVKEASAELIEQARLAGARDNITAVVVDVRAQL
jgi:type VI secretion system protein ImpM